MHRLDASRTRNQYMDTDLIDTVADRVEKAAPDQSKNLRTILAGVPELRQLVVAAAIRGLGARKYYFDRKVGAMVFEPDYIAQNKAAVFLAAYDAGLPLQGTVNLHLGGEKGMTIEDAMASSPAALEAIERTLAKAKARAKKPIEL